MGLGFKVGMAAFVKGAQEGADRARTIAQEERNNAWLESQRKETTTRQAREEETRLKMMAVGKDRFETVPQAGPGLEKPDGTEGAMAPIQVARKATQDETLRELSAVQRAAGNIEGALTSNQAADNYLDTQRKKFELDLADAVTKGDAERITQVINGVGKNRVLGQVAITPFERTLDGYGTVPTFNATFKVQDPSGKVVEQTVNSHDLQTRLDPYRTQMDNRLKVVEAGRWDKTFNRQSDEFKQTHALAVNTDTRQANTAALQLKTGNLAYDKAVDEHKVPVAVKQQVDILRDELKTLGTATAKAQAENLWTPDSPNAKAMMTRQAVVNNELRKLLGPYMGKPAQTAAPQAFGAPVKYGNKPDAAADKLPPMAAISYKDPVWDDVEPKAALAASVPLWVLQAIRTKGERSNGDQVSPKGARGVYQFIPATRTAFLKKHGVDAYSAEPGQQALAAALHLKESFERTGRWDKAIAGYNGGISGEQGTNTTTENAAYVRRTSGMPTQAPQ